MASQYNCKKENNERICNGVKYADLHVHTIFSDGTFTPEEVVETAREKGLFSIAICDHDCCDAIDQALDFSKKFQIEIIPGVELTVIREGKEMHVLGYFISWRNPHFKDVLKRVQRERVARIDKMIGKLKQFNIDVDKRKVMEKAGNKGSVGRLHLAQVLLDTGAVKTIQQAFDRYIGDFKPCYVEDVGFKPKEAIDVILEAKGVPVLAHPHTMGDDSLLDEFIKGGIRGIEVFHTDCPSTRTKKYERIAKENALLITGGSDCHGLGKGRILMGGVKLPYSFVEKLKEEARRHDR